MAVALDDAGVLDRYGVRLLGTPLEAIKDAEDRDRFRQLLIDIGEPVPPSSTVGSMDEAGRVVHEMGLPLVVRPAYTLGGTGGGIASTEDEFETITAGGLAASPISQVLLERSLVGWKEIEYEVMRDASDSCITICNMENLDPMGVHTGDSIVVAPSQTLSDKEYQALRSASLKIIRALGIEGGCNIQFALAPGDVVAPTLPGGGGREGEYYVIEVNPRVSRSSALASKATGYPIARVAAKIAAGRRLDEIPNAVTRRTVAAFEPALDYCVVKIPRWPFDKFPAGDRTVGTQMKATGEVDGGRPDLRGGVPEGRPLAGDHRAVRAVGRPKMARQRSRSAPAAAPAPQRRAPLGAAVRSQARRQPGGALPNDGGGPLVHPRVRKDHIDRGPAPLRDADPRPPERRPSGRASPTRISAC